MAAARRGGLIAPATAAVALPAPAAAGLADALLVLHAGVVGFVLVGELLFLAGGVRGWRWVRDLRLRVAHLVLMLYVAVQAWAGALCPLTVWEQSLRRMAGEQGHERGFVEHWVSRAIFFDLPAWVFLLAYTGFALLVVATWFLVPPGRRGTRPR
ncbi:hypothetical protein GCM10028862_05900 [Luteimonas pelagia]